YGLDYTLCPVVLLRPPRVMRSATEQWSPSASRHIGSRPLLVRIDQQRLVGLPGRKPPGYSRLMPRSSASLTASSSTGGGAISMPRSPLPKIRAAFIIRNPPPKLHFRR